MKYRPKLDPKVDLKGATPEKLARALLRNRNLPARVAQPVSSDQVEVEEVPADQAGDGIAHLDDGS